MCIDVMTIRSTLTRDRIAFRPNLYSFIYIDRLDSLDLYLSPDKLVVCGVNQETMPRRIGNHEYEIVLGNVGEIGSQKD
jgi:hypothetical protein